MNKTDVKIDFLLDTLLLLKENALRALEDKKKNPHDSFKMGINYGYYEIFHLIEEQAQAFNISPKELKLEGFSSEKDLLGLIKKEVNKENF